jgi:hypothetical protein
MKHQGDAALIVCIRSRAKSVRSEGNVLDEAFIPAVLKKLINSL